MKHGVEQEVSYDELVAMLKPEMRVKIKSVESFRQGFMDTELKAEGLEAYKRGELEIVDEGELVDKVVEAIARGAYTDRPRDDRMIR